MEAGAEHPGARTLKQAGPHRTIGIDLGTTNSALAVAEARGTVRIHDVLQVVAAGETAARATLPSFLYIPDQAQRDSGMVALPWNASPGLVAGVFARDEGALTPARQISSAKSWLSNPRVDRTAPLLPWDAEAAVKLSPVEASAELLGHLRDAWNHEHARTDPELALERQSLIVTVPASFDEEARELTLQAAQQAGLRSLTLLEEPLAALYAWIAAHRKALASAFRGGALILVCDVGGGTTDFSLIRADLDDADGELRFERIAIGEHLLLGGDNLDLALAVAVEGKLSGGHRLTLSQRQMLRRKCSAAKEQLLSEAAPDGVAITILGTGRGVVGGGMTAELTRTEVVNALTEGFLPITAADDLPARDRRVGLRELGLPFETEPAITRHLAAFLARAGAKDGRMARPDAVLFNGGFFAPAIARERVVDALARWFGERPRVLVNANPEAAVAVGAAFYGRLRGGSASARRLLIRAGSARAYYVGVDASQGGATTAVCVVPRGTEEGTTLAIEREFTVMTNDAAAFTLFSSIDRDDPAGAIVSLHPPQDAARHAPLVTTFRFGKRSRRVPLRVRLAAVFTETGTLELWCESTTTEHRWRLAFNLRAFDAGATADDDDEEQEGEPSGIVIADEAIARAAALIREVFGRGRTGAPPGSLIGELETILGHAKADWPIGAIRQLADVLLDVAPGRALSAAHESRWLNLAGFCVRPGFGSAKDPWRVSELRKIYVAGLVFPREMQNQIDWIVLWQRAAAGFSAGQQRELALRVAGTLGLGGRKAGRLNPQLERASWRLLASLERLDADQRTRFGDEIVARLRRAPRDATWAWAIGRLGARAPLYGPLNTVVPPVVAERWIGTLLDAKELTGDIADAIGRIGARTGDPARDVSGAVTEQAIAGLRAAGHRGAVELLATIVEPARMDAGRTFGESLPQGFRLA